MTCRVLHIVDSLQPSGAVAQLRLLMAELASTPLDMHVAALWDIGEPLDAAGWPRQPIVLARRQALELTVARGLRRLLVRLRPDVLHTWQPAAGLVGRGVALTLSKVRTVHSVRKTEPPSGTICAMSQLALDRCTHTLVANSEALAEIVRRRSPSRVRVVPDAAPPSAADAPSRSELLAELGLPSRDRLVAAVGSLQLESKLKDIVWAADLLKVVRDDVHLLIVGEGPYRPRLERFREQVQIADRVHLLGLRRDVPRLLVHCDVFWSAQAGPAGQTALLEAMMAGVPVVATTISGVGDLVVPGETGYLVPPGDRAGLARSANRLLSDAALARRLGQAAHDRASSQRSPGVIAARWSALYEQVAG